MKNENQIPLQLLIQEFRRQVENCRTDDRCTTKKAVQIAAEKNPSLAKELTSRTGLPLNSFFIVNSGTRKRPGGGGINRRLESGLSHRVGSMS